MKPLSAGMRDVLIEHLDGKRMRVVQPGKYAGLAAHKASQIVTMTNGLISRGYLRLWATSRHQSPTHTIITDTGRAALARLLAEYAEVLLRAERKQEAAAAVQGAVASK